jgi:hypothetical protein
VQPAQSGVSRVPEAIAWWRPHAEHAARRRWQAGHHGFPVAREIPHGAVWPQTVQVMTASGGQRAQSGPSGVRRSTGRTRPHPVQVSRFSGAVMKQFAQTGWPCPPRVTGCSAAGARLGAGVRDAGPADPDAVQRLVDAHYAAAAPACRADDAGDAGVVEDLDEPRDRAQRRQVPVPGQQRRVLFQRPCQFLLV